MSAAPVLQAPSGGRGAFVTRGGERGDHDFIFATWLRNYKHSSSFARRIPDVLFYKYHHVAIERILGRGAEVRVTHPHGSPDTILGYAVLEPSVIHYLYVKKPFRRLGIGAGLLDGLDPNGCLFTHWTKDWEHMLKKWPQAQYNPYLI